MPHAIEVLDFDALAGKHFAISPPCRAAQLACSILAMVFLLVIFLTIAVLFFDMLEFALRHIDRLFLDVAELPALDFHLSKSILHELIHGDVFRLHRELFVSPWLALQWALGIVVAVSFISFRLDLLAFAALAFVQGRALYAKSMVYASDFQQWQAGPAADVRSLMDGLWAAAVDVYFLFVLGVMLRHYFTLSAPERDILREGAKNVRFAGTTFLQAFGIPPNIRNSARKIRTVLFAYMSNLVGAGPVLLFVLIGAIASQLFWALVGPYVMGWYDPARMPVAEVGFKSFLLFNVLDPVMWVLFYVFLFVSFSYLGTRCLNVSRRFLRVSLEQAQAADPRPPVLFLRSFRNDLEPLPAPKSTFAYRLFNYAERNKSLDHLLLEEGTALGPVVALGDPTDTVPPYGAARGYAGQGDWRRMVADLMQAASAIVVCIDDTDNLWWEVEQVSANGFLAKSLLLLHPKYERSGQQAGVVAKIERLCGWPLAKSLGARSGQSLIGLWFDETAGLHVGMASRLSRAHYLLMLRWFLRAKARDATR